MCVWISIAALFSNFVGIRSVCECKFLHHHNPLPAEEGVANYESILIFQTSQGMRIPSQASLSSMLTQQPCTRSICPHIKMAGRSAVMTFDANNIKDFKKNVHMDLDCCSVQKFWWQKMCKRCESFDLKKSLDWNIFAFEFS